MNKFNDFWNWYIALFSDIDKKIILAAWAGTLGTITFFLTFVGRPLVRLIFGIKNPKIQAGITHTVMQSFLGTAMTAPDITCTIVNGNKAIFIQRPLVELSRKVNGHKTYDNALIHATNINRPIFPLQLQPSEQKKIDIGTVDLYNQLLQHIRPRDTIRFVVKTTTGKKYKSNKLTKQHIVSHMQIPNNV